MKKRLKPNRSNKSFFILLSILMLSLIYILNDNVTQENHIDNVANIISQPTVHIEQATESISNTIETISYSKKELMCLAQNIFFEARGADIDEKIRVANVTINRVNSDKFPSTVCENVFSPYQFSWTHEKHDLKSTINSNKLEYKAWQESLNVAKAQLGHRLPDLTNGSMFYHTHKIKPQWSKKMNNTVSSKWHQYYKY